MSRPRPTTNERVTAVNRTSTTSRRRKVAAGVGTALIAAAVVQQLKRPPSERDWHGTLGGVVPYDLRPPTLDRLKASLWDPDSERCWLPRALGVGWSPNLARVVSVLEGWRPVDE
jgi:hypothetical protein